MFLSQINLYKSGKEKSYLSLDIPWWPSSKESASNVRDSASIPESGRSLGEGNGNTLQYSFFFFFNPIDRGACGLQCMGSQLTLSRSRKNALTLKSQASKIFKTLNKDYQIRTITTIE